jgi:cell division protein FtsW
MDVTLAAVVIALLGFGVVMVYSASVIEATVVFRDPQYFLKRQAVYAGASFALMLVLSHIDYHHYRRMTYPILGMVTVLMILSVIGFGHTGGGAARWLAIGPIHIQPSEAAKLALVLWLAYSLEKKRDKVKSFSIGMLPHLIMAGFLMILCLKQPDFGGASVLLFLTFTLLFVAGARLGYLLGAGMLGALFAVWAVRFTAYRWERMLAWFNMAEHRQDLAYQPFQAVMSFGSGQTAGMGVGKGLQVLYLPEAHTDFIAAIIGEELGFLGILGLCTVFLVIVAQNRAPGRRRVRPIHRHRHLGPVWRAGTHQHRGGHVDLPDQGVDATVRELRRLVATGVRGGHGHSIEYLTAQPDERQRPHVDRHAPGRGQRDAGHRSWVFARANREGP